VVVVVVVVGIQEPQLEALVVVLAVVMVVVLAHLLVLLAIPRLHPHLKETTAETDMTLLFQINITLVVGVAAQALLVAIQIQQETPVMAVLELRHLSQAPLSHEVVAVVAEQLT
jgi:nitrate reductase gamma subunit